MKIFLYLECAKRNPNLRPGDWSVIIKLPKFCKKTGYLKILFFDRGNTGAWLFAFVSDSYCWLTNKPRISIFISCPRVHVHCGSAGLGSGLLNAPSHSPQNSVWQGMSLFWQKHKKPSQTTLALLRPLLASCLLTFHWPTKASHEAKL